MAENNFLDQLAGTKATDSNFLDSIAGTIPDSSDSKKPVKPGLWQRVKTQGSEAWKDLVNKEKINPFEGALRVAGHVGEAAGDVLMAGAGKLYDLTTSDLTKETVKDIGKTIADTDIAKGAVEVAKDVGGLYGKLPERVRNDLGAAFSSLNLIPAWQAGKSVVPAARKGSEAVIGLANLAKGQTIRSEVEYGFKKGIKPTVVGKSTAAQTEKFYDNATTATKDIISASPEAIPQTVEEMSQQVRNVKKTLWDNSSTMARQAGEEGALVDVFPVISDMRTAAKDPNLIRANPGASSRLNAMADAWESQPLKISPPEAEDLIAQLNAQTKGFWKNPDWNKANDALFAERAANLTRSQTDAAVEAYQGPGWQDFRNRYGAQSAIEKEVSHRANVHARANVRGFFDLSDVFTTGEFVSAIATMNPASLARAAAMYSAKKYIKSQNNVDNIVRKMFRNVKGIMEKNGGITPLQTMSGEPLRFKSSGKHQPIPIPGVATPRPGPGVATELVIGPEGIIRDVPIRPASDYASRFRPGSGEVPPIPGAADVTPVTGIPTETFWKGGLLEERPIIPKDRFYWEGGQLKERPIPAPSGGVPSYSPIPGPGLKNYKSPPSGASGGMPGGNPPPTGPLNPAIMPGGNPPPRPADRGPVQDAVYDNSGLSLPNGQLMLPEPQRMLPSPSDAASSTVGLRKLADKLTAELEGGSPPESMPGGLAGYPVVPPKPRGPVPVAPTPVQATPPVAPPPPPAVPVIEKAAGETLTPPGIVQPAATSGGKQGINLGERYPSVPDEFFSNVDSATLSPESMPRQQGRNISARDDKTLLHEAGHMREDLLAPTPELEAQWKTIHEKELNKGPWGDRPVSKGGSADWMWEDLLEIFGIYHKKASGYTLTAKEMTALERNPGAVNYVQENLSKFPSPLPEGGAGRATEIKLELAKLQSQYEKKMAGNARSGMVPPSIKSDALSGITKKMDKLDAELASLTPETGAKGGNISALQDRVEQAKAEVALALEKTKRGTNEQKNAAIRQYNSLRKDLNSWEGALADAEKEVSVRPEAGAKVEPTIVVEQATPTEVKVSTPRAAADPNITPKEQKQYLLAEIKKAIEIAPDRTEIIPPGTATHVRIEIPGDGVFRIPNTKERLQSFAKEANQYPTTIPKPKKLYKTYSEKPTGKRISSEDIEYYNEFKPRKQEIISTNTFPDGTERGYYNQGYYTDGHYIIKTEKPAKVKIFDGDQPDIQKVINSANTKLSPAEIVGEASWQSENGTPFVTSHLISKNGLEVWVNPEFIDAILTKYPTAKAYISDTAQYPVIFKDGKTVVGEVMPQNMKTVPIPDTIKVRMEEVNKKNPAWNERQTPEITSRAHGGPVKAGKPYLVGENGPELIIPKHDGRVIPNGGLMNYFAKRQAGLRNHMAVQ